MRRKKSRFNKFIELLDNILSVLWIASASALFPVLLACMLSINDVEDELAEIYFTIAFTLSIYVFAGIFINIFCVTIIRGIYRIIDKKRHPEKYQPVTREQIAKDFEELAKAMREKDDEENN